MALDAGAMRAYAYTCDCSRKEEVYRVADQVKKEVGDVSILINNAGIETGKNFLDCPDELMEKSFDMNFKAHLWKKGGIKTTIMCPLLIKTGVFEGCTTNCPSLLPILETEYAVRKIVDAVLQEKLGASGLRPSCEEVAQGTPSSGRVSPSAVVQSEIHTSKGFSENSVTEKMVASWCCIGRIWHPECFILSWSINKITLLEFGAGPQSLFAFFYDHMKLEKPPKAKSFSGVGQFPSVQQEGLV
ncbi:Epidermal retinal dehydrogenase 2 [Pteropus alecto]|uniref:Epidermal retinal dehydrogenase 2 n=1 Tax=Pteropus alecto TaxID=9402 RepID=L5JV06_PTEAL|nr:Epidermal retinal dehydrogenase 2 [Pteropus alecto]